MGKKRRILRRGKFAALRKHRKFSGLVEANLSQKEEPEEVVQSVAPDKIEESIKLESATPPVSLVEKPAPTPAPKVKKASTKVSAKKTSSTKRSKARRPARKKTATQSP